MRPIDGDSAVSILTDMATDSMANRKTEYDEGFFMGLRTAINLLEDRKRLPSIQQFFVPRRTHHFVGGNVCEQCGEPFQDDDEIININGAWLHNDYDCVFDYLHDDVEIFEE